MSRTQQRIVVVLQFIITTKVVELQTVRNPIY